MPKKKAKKVETNPKGGGSRRGRGGPGKPFPSSTFEDALTLAVALQKHGGGQKMRRLTLFEKIGKSPDSGPSRQLVINSGRYGLTEGGARASHIAFTPEGSSATNPDADPAERLQARFDLAIRQATPFQVLYETYKGSRLPAREVLRDTAREQGVDERDADECVDTFLLNAKFVGLIQTFSGSDRLLPIEHLIEELPAAPESAPAGVDVGKSTDEPPSPDKRGRPPWSKICFYISPIGDEGTDQRDHSDFFLTQLIEPAMKDFGLQLVRADHIGKPGMITAQIIEHIVKSHLAIADLSFHNPNVFYELSLRHACRLPTVQVIRTADEIPFDLEQFRTIRVDTSNVYLLYPKIETYRAEIANQIRTVLQDPEQVDNPITAFCPGLKVSLPA